MSVFSSWFNNPTGYSAKQVRQLFGAFLAKKPGTRPLGSRSGLSPGIGVEILTVTSTTWTLTPFTGVLDLETDTTQGPSPFVVDANLTGGVTAANGANDRIDLLSLTMDIGTSTPPHVVYTVGTPAGSPAVPATPANSIPLAQILVPKTGTGSPSVTWVAPTFTASAPKTGGVTPVTFTAVNSRENVSVPFPPGLFKQTPIVVCSPNTSNPDNCQAGATAASTTGFTLNAFSTTITTRQISWIAIEPDA
jgi:hypothetical protein